MAASKKKRCYIYTRVSTQMQVDGYSLDAQRDRLMKEANHREMTVAAEFSDEGKSGKNAIGRPRFTEMMNRIQNGNPDNVDYVLVFKLSRFGGTPPTCWATCKSWRTTASAFWPWRTASTAQARRVS